MAKLSTEEKIDKLATDYVLEVISKSEKPLTSAQQSELFEAAKRRITIDRNQYLQVLNEAEEELKNLKWSHIQPQVLPGTKISGRSIGGNHGFRGLFIVTFGNFIFTKSNSWIYRPNQSQFINLVKRWPKRKQCENFANKLRDKYRPKGEYKLIETAEMEEFKKDILDQINELRESV